MPHDRKEAIRENLVAAQLELTQVLDRVGPDDRSRIGPNEGWTVRKLLTDLITSETGFVPTIRRMSADNRGVPADFDPNRGTLVNSGAARTLPPLRFELSSTCRSTTCLLCSTRSINIARARGGYLGDRSDRWPAVDDVALKKKTQVYA